MSFARSVRRKVSWAIAPAVFLALFAYFVWNVTQGDRGLRSFAQREDLLRQAKAEQLQAERERDAWERRVAALQSQHIDRDALDERVRAMLNLADPNDVIVAYKPGERLF